MTDTAAAQKNDAMVVAPSTAIAAPMPMFTGEAMRQAFAAYKDLQRALDESMPDQIMVMNEGTKNERKFRKKGYWRAVAVAFNLDVKPVEESREVSGSFRDSRPNFGYVVTYTAKAPNGRSATGDGSCFAIEKAKKFRCPHPKDPERPYGKTVHFPAENCPDFDPDAVWERLPEQATEHNIRSHAHTRAFNRAVSNLVGFGEVSAEEVDRDAHPGHDAGSDDRGATSRETVTSSEKVDTSNRRNDETYVNSVKIKSKAKEDDSRQWTLYAIEFQRGKKVVTASTFDHKFAEVATVAQKEGHAVKILTEEKNDKKYGKQLNLTAIERVFFAHVDEDEPAATEQKAESAAEGQQQAAEDSTPIDAEVVEETPAPDAKDAPQDDGVKTEAGAKAKAAVEDMKARKAAKGKQKAAAAPADDEKL